MNPSEIFIRSEHRPDLRAAAGPLPRLGPAMDPNPNCFTSFPRSYRFSGCGEKNDKADKKKEIQKDDKAARDPITDIAFQAHAGTLLTTSVAESARACMFA